MHVDVSEFIVCREACRRASETMQLKSGLTPPLTHCPLGKRGVLSHTHFNDAALGTAGLRKAALKSTRIS
jgi:hypothetical protein